MEPLLGMPAGWLPRDSAQLDTYMREMLAGGSLVVTDTSRALARALLYPPQWYVAWPAFRAMQLLTIGSLPPSIRQAYGFEWRARDARALARWTTLLRTSLRLLPPLAREWPMARRRDPSGALLRIHQWSTLTVRARPGLLNAAAVEPDDCPEAIATAVIRYRFSDFTLSPQRRLLLREGREVPLIPRYFDLLVLLIERRHEAVHRREIFDRVWTDVDRLRQRAEPGRPHAPPHPRRRFARAALHPHGRAPRLPVRLPGCHRRGGRWRVAGAGGACRRRRLSRSRLVMPTNRCWIVSPVPVPPRTTAARRPSCCTRWERRMR